MTTGWMAWVDKAEADFLAMQVLLQSANTALCDVVCYHAQLKKN
jgi:hypothetical protein